MYTLKEVIEIKKDELEPVPDLPNTYLYNGSLLYIRTDFGYDILVFVPESEYGNVKDYGVVFKYDSFKQNVFNLKIDKFYKIYGNGVNVNDFDEWLSNERYLCISQSRVERYPSNIIIKHRYIGGNKYNGIYCYNINKLIYKRAEDSGIDIHDLYNEAVQYRVRYSDTYIINYLIYNYYPSCREYSNYNLRSVTPNEYIDVRDFVMNYENGIPKPNNKYINNIGNFVKYIGRNMIDSLGDEFTYNDISCDAENIIDYFKNEFDNYLPSLVSYYDKTPLKEYIIKKFSHVCMFIGVYIAAVRIEKCRTIDNKSKIPNVYRAAISIIEKGETRNELISLIRKNIKEINNYVFEYASTRSRYKDMVEMRKFLKISNIRLTSQLELIITYSIKGDEECQI